MFTGYQSTEELAKNLIDAGCSEEMIEDLLFFLLHGDKQKSLCKLEEHRTELLNDIHKEQSGIAYLDELLCDLQNQNTSRSLIV